jgi:hypothetical protein
MKKVNVSTFAAAFPMDDPRYVVVAMLDAPKATADTFGYTTAGWVSAPIVSKGGRPHGRPPWGDPRRAPATWMSPNCLR